MARQRFRRILVPFDFSDPATRALRTGADLALQHRGRIVVLHALATFSPMKEFAIGAAAVWTPPTELLDRTQRQLALAVPRALRQRRPATECRVVLGDPFEAIMQAASKADLIVMGTRGRTSLQQLVIGSVAEKVVRHAPVPVLTIGAASPRPRRRRRA